MRIKSANASMSVRTAVLGVVVELSVLGRGVEQTSGSLVALLREDLVGHAHFDVISLRREQEEGLVLRLPSEAGDRPVVRAAIDIAAQVGVGRRCPIASCGT